MVASGWMVIFLLPKGCLIWWGDIGCLHCVVHSWAAVDLLKWVWWDVLAPREPRSPRDAASWQSSGCHRAAAACACKSWKAEGMGPGVTGLPFSPQCGWAGAMRSTTAHLFSVLGFILRLFILSVFLCSPNIKYLLSAYSDRNTFEAYVLVIIFLPHQEQNVSQGTWRNPSVVLR